MAEFVSRPMRRVWLTAAVLVAVTLSALPLASRGADAQIDDDPTSVLVRADGATSIVNGIVRGESETITTSGGMHLVTEIEVYRDVDGTAPERLLVETPGGENAAGLRQVVSHQPAFHDGDRVQIALAEAPNREGGVISALFSDDRLPVYSIAGGMQGTAWLSGPPNSQVDEFVSGSAEAAGDFALHGGKWSAFPVSYSINPTGAPEGGIDAIRTAMDTWEAVPNTSIDFDYAGTTTATAPIGDWDNVVAWIYPSNPADTYLAQATWWMLGGNTIVAFDVVINRNYTITVGEGGYDLESVALHEFGHVLGLGHVNQSSERMYPAILVGTEARTLGSGDVGGAQSLYYSESPSTPTPEPTSTPVPTPTAPPTPTAVPTPTSTPEPTATPLPTPTATPTPEVGTLNGTVSVLNDGSPIFAAEVCARMLFPEREYCSYTRTDGTYTIRDIPSGNYAVFANDRARRFLENCAGDKACDQPQLYGLSTTQGVDGVDIAMDAIYTASNPKPTVDPLIGEGSISGRLTGSGVAGRQVCAEGIRLGVLRCGTTDAGGAYTLSELPTDNYRVEVDGGVSCYATGSSSCGNATPVGVVSPLARSGIDMSV